MCIITKDALYDLGTGKEGRAIEFDLGFAWFTIDGQTTKIPMEDIVQIISFEEE